MACSSILTYTRPCGNEFLVAGTEKLYMIAFKDLALVGTASEVYTTSNGIISSITFGATATKFVEVGILKASTGLTEEVTKNPNGTGFITQTFTTRLIDISNENRIFVESVMNQPVAVIQKLYSGKLVAAGLNGKLELSALTGGTGIAEGDDIGYTLTFTGIDKNLIRLVDPSFAFK